MGRIKWPCWPYALNNGANEHFVLYLQRCFLIIRSWGYCRSFDKICAPWDKCIPGIHIDSYVGDKLVEHSETLKQMMEEKKFFIQCIKENKFITKLMSFHWVLTWVEDHVTMCRMTKMNKRKQFVLNIHNLFHESIEQTVVGWSQQLQVWSNGDGRCLAHLW